MNKLKSGDVVFIKNKHFDSWCVLKSGAITEVVEVINFENLIAIKSDSNSYMIIDLRAVSKYTKNN